jgi:hypothetical protein
MRFLYRSFKLLFSDDEQLIAKWNQLSDGKAPGKHREAVAKELRKREYRYDGAKWIKSSS